MQQLFFREIDKTQQFYENFVKSHSSNFKLYSQAYVHFSFFLFEHIQLFSRKFSTAFNFTKNSNSMLIDFVITSSLHRTSYFICHLQEIGKLFPGGLIGGWWLILNQRTITSKQNMRFLISVSDISAFIIISALKVVKKVTKVQVIS